MTSLVPRVIRRFALICAVPMLAACENSAYSYVIDDTQNHSISLVREQGLAWQDKVTQYLIVARFPECQKRVEIEPGTTEAVRFELYEAGAMRYVAHQGSNWYAISTEVCDLQRFDKPPAAPGRLLGHFDYEDGRLHFITAESARPS